jgi:hypothetical protein
MWGGKWFGRLDSSKGNKMTILNKKLFSALTSFIITESDKAKLNK